MLTHLRPAVSLVVLFTLLLGLVFPLSSWGSAAWCCRSRPAAA